MPFEKACLLGIHAHATPFFDALFLFSHQLGTFTFCAAVVIGMAILHASHGDRRAAALWLLLGCSTGLMQWQLKDLVGRERPLLWPRLVNEVSYSFPSGHALASATFYPLLAWSVARVRPSARRLAWVLGVALPLFVGFGRLYLGVHWPTDVVAGWTIGALQTAAAMRLVARPTLGDT